MKNSVGSGSALHWERLDVDFGAEGLANGVYGNKAWMKRLTQPGFAAPSPPLPSEAA